MALWSLSNQESFREIGNLFGMNRGNVHFCTYQVLKVISEKLKPVYIKWPNAAECQQIADAFESKHGIPDVVGCIDGTHVAIRAPSRDRDSYINRKGFASINILAVCNHSQKFTYVYADRAGSVHDARVLRVSSLGQMIENESLCPGVDRDKYHLLGDSAYPLLPTLLVPYRDNGHLTSVQTRFNTVHSSTRSVIERAFGRVKGMFRRLRAVDCTDVLNALTIIEAAFTLHNFIIQHEQLDESFDSDPDVEEPTAPAMRGNPAIRRATKEKRDKIAVSI